MSTIYLHNMAYRSREDALLEWDQPKSELAYNTFWNIWKRHAVGSKIQNGTRILLIASWPKPGGMERRFLWDVRAWNVAKWEDVDWDTATRNLGEWSGYGTRDVRGNPYTFEKKKLEGPLFVQAWCPKPETWLDVPVPDDVRVTRNGWAAVDEEVVATWGLPGWSPKGSTPKRPHPKRKTGQGRRLDVAAREAVEQRAMTLARKWCVKQGWSEIEDTSLVAPWDFEAIDSSGKRRFVEVKGSTTVGVVFEVTAGEVKAARKHGLAHLLIAVGDIELKHAADQSVEAVGGNLWVYDPWKPTKDELMETRYTWIPGPDRF